MKSSRILLAHARHLRSALHEWMLQISDSGVPVCGDVSGSSDSGLGLCGHVIRVYAGGRECREHDEAVKYVNDVKMKWRRRE